MRYEAHGSELLEHLLAAYGDDVAATHAQHGDATALVARTQIVPVLTFLRDDPATSFEMLTDLCAVDYLGDEPRFEVVYHLYSVSQNHRLRIKARVAEDPCEIDSACGVWPAADWMEREVFDLYGIRFVGHPGLRRLLLADEFEGHPLRKDHPKQSRASGGARR